MIFADLVKKTPRTSTAEEEVFKARRGLRNLKEEPASTASHRHTKAAENFKKLVDSKGYLPQQFFNYDETGLFWKKVPKRIYITAEATVLPSQKPMKDRLKLLFCVNVAI